MRLLLILFLIVSCSKKDVRSSSLGTNPNEKTQFYFSTATSLTVEVAYESGHEPFAEGTTITQGGNTNSIWQILDENLNALFQGRSTLPVITVPKKLADMKEIPDQSKTSWTVSDIMSLASRYRTNQSTQTHTYFWVIFLGGHFNDGTQDLATTIGVSVGGTTVIAIFKDVVNSTGNNPGGIVPRYVEQSTIVHEIGHALGLVNNGLPMQESHQDDAHGHHCNNPNCVMYWLNEGKSDMIQFAIRMSTSGSVIMWDQKCLEDARKF
ncbi:MAG: hypothetical protein K2P81_05155 [Bacteriovoracaceae bacterium]|nr:hypothetical protein [Bacteriovoracaceae bacterium]